jgi:hypothetical protein
MDRASSIAIRGTVFFQETFDRGRYEFAYLVKVIAPGQFRAVPAQISPMYVPGVHASSEPQASRSRCRGLAHRSLGGGGGLAMRLALATIWILAGSALTAGVYWHSCYTGVHDLDADGLPRAGAHRAGLVA